MVSLNKINNLMKTIAKNTESAEDYHTGLVGEKIIVSSYETMSIDQLVKMRYIINKLIQKKKGLIKHNESKNVSVSVNDTDKCNNK